jgi:ADP-ribosylglycohydrolase
MAAIGVRLAADRVATNASLMQPRSSKAFFSAESALATLPLALFFYENVTKQQQILRQTVQLWQSPPGTEAGLLAVGYAIAEGLNEQVERLTLLPRTIVYLKQSTAKPTDTLLELIGALEQTQVLIQQEAGLHTAIERLRTAAHSCHEAIALAFYCFLSSFADLRLSLLRAARCGEAASVVCALTGALSGSHHGLSGLPLTWRLDRPLPLLGELSNLELGQLATHLFAVWSGSYHPATAQRSIAIAAPGLLRPR